MKSPWTHLHTTIALVVVPTATLLIGRFLPSAIWAWIIIGVLLAAMLVVLGHGVTGLWRGMFIDERNSISLTRLQTAIWTIVVVSAFVTAGLVNLRVGADAPLDISIPGELWALLGISATSLVGSPLIRTGKEGRIPKKESFTATLNELGFDVADSSIVEGRNLRVDDATLAQLEAVSASATDGAHDSAPPSSVGVVLVKNQPADSAWSDIFKGEDTGNGAHLDLGKVQMFYFTLAIVVAYVVALGSQFVDVASSGIVEFPALTEGIVALLGISHTAFLANKAVDRP